MQRISFKHGGRTYSGTVTANHGDQNRFRTGAVPDRYVEFVHDEASAGRTGDPGYVKEGPDEVTDLTITGDV